MLYSFQERYSSSSSSGSGSSSRVFANLESCFSEGVFVAVVVVFLTVFLHAVF